MNFARFFVDRPIFAGVVSIFITIIGGIAYFALPVAQYPEIAPPNVVVTAQYPGASAETVAETVQRAEHALLNAKAGGQNRVVLG